MQGKDVLVIKLSDLNTGMLFWADQVLVATNAMRTRINDEMRQILGRGDKPEDGDKVICCRNYWDLLADNESPLINGTIGTIKDSFLTFNKLPGFFFPNYIPQNIDILRATFVGDCGESYGSLPMDNKLILEGAKTLDWKTEYKIANSKKYSHLLPLEFTYAYAITTHKSQGSEWDKVLVIEERFPFDKEEHARWLYTACTRASEKLVLVRP